MEKFEEIMAEDISIYADRDILKEYLKDNVFYINIEGSGKYMLKIVDGE